MTKISTPKVEPGFQVFLSEGGEEVGAVRGVSPTELLVYIENAGEFAVPLTALRAVHDEKVVIDVASLEPRVREALRHAHEREEPGL